MKFLLVFLCLGSSFLFAQPAQDVYVMDITLVGEKMRISGVKNISNNPGYDSQPSFISDSKLVYAGTENKQTEIQIYDLVTQSKQRLNTPTSGGEYSPQKFPVSKKVAAVRLDTSGLQRLYGYDYSIPSQTAPEMLLPTAEIAYFAFHDNDRIVASVLGGDQLNLVIANFKTKEVTNYIENSGRSIHTVPDSNSVSYTLTNEDKNMDVYLLDIDGDGQSFFVCQLPVGVQDHCWINNSQLLLGSGSKLYLYDLYGAQEWKEVADLSSYNISDINRITVSPNGKKIALVANET
ncbi:MAG: hypothetical protein ACI849_001781 [Patiriisocius sp.]|jgi:hypothetical protein